MKTAAVVVLRKTQKAKANTHTPLQTRLVLGLGEKTAGATANNDHLFKKDEAGEEDKRRQRTKKTRPAHHEVLCGV